MKKSNKKITQELNTQYGEQMLSAYRVSSQMIKL